MLWGWLSGIAPEKKQQEGVYTATIEWSPDGLIERVNRLYSRVEALEKIITSMVVADDPDDPEEERKTTAARIKALQEIAQAERGYRAAEQAGFDLARDIGRVLVCKGEDIERAEALLRATCEGDAAHETPIKTGPAMGEAGQAGQEVP